MRYGVKVALVPWVLALALVASGCSDEDPPPAPVAAPGPSAVPAFDGSLEPAAAVLALVPESAVSLTVTDFDQVRAELGLGDPTPAGMADFWARADAERPLLTRGLLRGEDAAAAVSWEAHFFDGADREIGWVLGFREGTDLAGVASSPALVGATIDPEHRLATSGTATDPAQSWAADPELTALVGLPANSTYVSRDCIPGQGGVDLDELGAYAVQFEGALVTARLGAGRHDLFIRMRMAGDDPGFAEVWEGGVADPRTGRIGFRMVDPAAAARQALRHQLPFAACS